MEIKKINKLSFANVVALLYAVFAFIITIGTFIYLLAKVILEKEMAGHLAKYIFINLGLDFIISLAVAAAVGVIGWIVGLAASAFYNFLAREIGGVKVEFVDEAASVLIDQKSTFAKATVDKEKQELFKY